jgi:hypothetical protein
MSYHSYSVFVFDITKKILLCRQISVDLFRLIYDEIVKNFGLDYVKEKNSLRNNYNEISDDLIYEYFSPLVNSYEISKELSYSYEFGLFKKNNLILRFSSFKNCLIMYVYANNTIMNNTNHSSSSLTSSIYSQYSTDWAAKSMLSLIRYKFGICSDDKCFNKINSNEIKLLFLQWTQLYSNDLNYFVETIEQLEVFIILNILFHLLNYLNIELNRIE